MMTTRTLSLPFISLLILATVLLVAALVVSQECRACQNGTSVTTENFDAEIDASSLPVVKSVEGDKYGRVEVLDGSKKELGWCLSLDGRVQMCQVDAHRYHEMLVQYACSVRDLGPGKGIKPLRALIVYGGDGMAKDQVVATKKFRGVVVLDEEKGLTQLRSSLMSSPTTPDERYGNIKHLLQSYEPGSFDLIIVDLKDRFSQDHSKLCRMLSKLLDRGGVLSVGSMIPASTKWKGGVEDLADARCFKYRLPFTFYSELKSTHVKMELFADWDIHAAVQGEGEAASGPNYQNFNNSQSSALSKLKFFDPTKPLVFYMVPWLASF